MDFSNAEDDFTPNCYKEKVWELIKLVFEKIIRKIKSTNQHHATNYLAGVALELLIKNSIKLPYQK